MDVYTTAPSDFDEERMLDAIAECVKAVVGIDAFAPSVAAILAMVKDGQEAEFRANSIFFKITITKVEGDAA